MLKFSSALSSALVSATSKQAWCEAVIAALGSTRRVICKRSDTAGDVWGTGTTFLDILLTGSMAVVDYQVHNLGVMTTITTQTASNLATGFAVLRIEGATSATWVEGTIGLPGSGADFILRANLTALGMGVGFNAATIIKAPPRLPNAAATSVVQALTLRNSSGSTQAANFVSKMFGLPIKQGDMPAGEYPVFTLTDDTPCPATVYGLTYWPDGSMRFAAAFMRVPASIAGSGTLTVNVKNGGSAPAASALSASTITAASDIKVEATGLKNWTAGLWTSSLNQGVTDGDVQVIGTGPAGVLLRVYEGFRNGGADHGQAGVWHYIAALQNLVGGLYGLRHLGKFANGWHDVTTPTINVLVADGVALKDGASTIRSIAPLAAARAFSWSTSLSAANVTNLVSGMAVKVTTTGTLPTGLSSTTAYFVRLTGGNGFTLHPSISDVEFNSNTVSVTGAGSGTHTLTPVFHLESYAAGPYTVGTSGEYDFIQAGGTGSECTVDVELDRDYVGESKVLGPVRTDTSLTILDDRSYSIDTLYDVSQNQDSSGERIEIGYLTGWCLRHWVRGDRFKTIRTYALQQNLKSWSIRRLATKAPLNISNSTYTGMGTGIPDYRYRPSNPAGNSGVNSPAEYYKTRGAQDWAHQPHFLSYAYMISGEPHYLDALNDMAVAAIGNLENKSPVVSSTTYRSIVLRTEGQRVEAWVLRDVAWAAMFTPDTYLGSALGTFYKGVLASNFDYLKAEKLTGDTFAQTNKFYPGISKNQAPWMVAYLLTSFNLAYTATNDADAKLAIEDILGNYNAVRTNLGLHAVSAYYQHFITVPKAATSWDDVLLEGTLLTPIVVTTGTDTINAVPKTGYGAITNDAPIMPLFSSPGGLTDGARYFMRDVSGANFKVATTKGSTAIDLTTAGTSDTGAWAATLPGISNSTMADGIAPKSYATMIVGGTRWAKALGCTIPSGFETAIETVYGAGPTFTDDPVYALKNTFAP